MKNFLGLLDTNPVIDIDIVVTTITDNGTPLVRLAINQEEFWNDRLSNTLKISKQVKLLEPINITVSMDGKNYSQEKETAVVIETIKIDGFEIVPQWTHLATYENEHNYTQPTAYLGFNGVWKLSISEPFYRWRHKVTGQGWLLDPT